MQASTGDTGDREDSLLAEVQLVEISKLQFENECPGVVILHGSLSAVESSDHTIVLACGRRIKYRTLCICVGARPKDLLSISYVNSEISLLYDPLPHIHTLRDTDSVGRLFEALTDATTQACAPRVAVVGNGGIALEMIHLVCSNPQQYID